MFLKREMTGDRVRTLQKLLASQGYSVGLIDGYFGSLTEAAVVKFQLDKSLNADGVVGPITAEKLGLENEVEVGEIEVPKGLKQIMETFGDPLQPGYWKAYGDFCTTPPDLNHVFTYKDSIGRNGFYCNKLIIIPMLRALNDIVTEGLTGELERFGGCYNVRKMRGGTKLSTHSWGIAIDLDPHENPLGAKPKINLKVVKCFERHGFVWGGRWKRKDGMHFQFAKGY